MLPKPPCINDLHVLDCTIGMAAQDACLRWAGEPAPEKRKVWVIARQHPGETMAEFFAEVGLTLCHFPGCSALHFCSLLHVHLLVLSGVTCTAFLLG